MIYWAHKERPKVYGLFVIWNRPNRKILSRISRLLKLTWWYSVHFSAAEDSPTSPKSLSFSNARQKKRWIYASLFGPIRSELGDPMGDLCQSIPSFLSVVSTTMYSSKKYICTPYSVNKTKTMLTKNNGACVCSPLAWKGAGASTRALMMLDLCTTKVIL